MMRGAALVWIAAAAALPAQDLRLDARLAADPARDGPTALVWLRQEVLPRLSQWPSGLDPFAGVRLEIDGEAIRCTADAGGARGYFDATLQIRGIGQLTGQCARDGLEQWHGERLSLPESRVRNLAALTGLLHHHGPVSLDTAAFAGGLWNGASACAAAELALSLGPTECGPLTVKIVRHGERWEIAGRSDGGLLLPAALAFLADLASRPPQAGALLAARAMDEAQAWRVLAAAALDGGREEAARQLSQHADDSSRDMLERLLQADDYTRVVAMESLIRAGATATLPRLLEAVDPARPDTEELAELGLWTLLPKLPESEQRRWLAQLDRHRSPRLRTFAQRYHGQRTAAVMPGAPAETQSQTEIGWSPLRIGAFVFFLGSTLLLGWLVIGTGKREEL